MKGQISRLHPIPPGDENKWFEFADELYGVGVELFAHAQIDVTEKRFAEPKILGLGLLCRTLSNFKGAVAVAKCGLVVEARILTRACFENSFLVAGLAEKGDAFVKAMYADDVKGIRARGEFLLDKVASPEELTHAFAGQLRDNLAAMKKNFPNARYLNPKEVAGQSVIEKSYLLYSLLSSDAAHPTITALKRHLVVAIEDGQQVYGLDVAPVLRANAIADTVNLACNAVIGVIVGANQMIQVEELAPQIAKIFHDYEALIGVVNPIDVAARK